MQPDHGSRSHLNWKAGIKRLFRRRKLILSAIAGIALGIAVSRYLFVGSWLSLILWGVVGLAIGYWSGLMRGFVNGGVYGFALAFTFMVSGYTGSASLLSRLPFFAIMGIVGAVCGSILGLIGSLAKKIGFGRRRRR